MRNRSEGSPLTGDDGTADGFPGFGSSLRSLAPFALQKAAFGGFRERRENAEGEKKSCVYRNKIFACHISVGTIDI